MQNALDQPDQLLTIRQLADFVPLSRSSIYRLIRLGQFPRQIPLAANRVAWRARDIAEWQATRDPGG